MKCLVTYATKCVWPEQAFVHNETLTGGLVSTVDALWWSGSSSSATHVTTCMLVSTVDTLWWSGSASSAMCTRQVGPMEELSTGPGEEPLSAFLLMHWSHRLSLPCTPNVCVRITRCRQDEKVGLELLKLWSRVYFVQDEKAWPETAQTILQKHHPLHGSGEMLTSLAENAT
eukprot:1145349-Pelagomonas_calceolata.AAC.4